MKRVRSLLLVLSAVACCIFAARTMQHTHAIPKSYDIAIDTNLSPVAHINITNGLYTYGASINSPRIIAQRLAHDFPCLCAVKTSVNPHGVISFTIDAHAPLFALNDSTLMLENGLVVARDLYNEAHLVGIKKIACAENQISSLPSCFKTIMEQIFLLSTQELAITWLCDHEIVVADPKNPSMALLCSADSLPNKKIMQDCLHIYNDMKSQKMSMSKKTEKRERTQTLWVADIRFKNQIIVRAGVGGHTYG